MNLTNAERNTLYFLRDGAAWHWMRMTYWTKGGEPLDHRGNNWLSSRTLGNLRRKGLVEIAGDGKRFEKCKISAAGLRELEAR